MTVLPARPNTSQIAALNTKRLKQPRPASPSEFPPLDTRAYLYAQAAYFANTGSVLIYHQDADGQLFAFDVLEPGKGILCSFSIGK